MIFNLLFQVLLRGLYFSLRRVHIASYRYFKASQISDSLLYLQTLINICYGSNFAPQLVHFLSVKVKQHISPIGNSNIPQSIPSRVMCSSKDPT